MDVETTNAVPALGGSAGSSGTEGRAATAAPSVTDDVDERFYQPDSGTADARTDTSTAADDADDSDEGEEAPDELTLLKRQLADQDKRIKGFQSAMQREVEARQQYERWYQQQQAAQPIRPTQEEAAWVDKYRRFQIEAQYMTPEQAQYAWQQIETEAQVLQQKRGVMQQQAQVQAMQRQVLPLVEQANRQRLKSAWKEQAKVNVPDAVLDQAKKLGRNVPPAVIQMAEQAMAFGYAHGQRSAAEQRQKARLEADAKVDEGDAPAPPTRATRTGGGDPFKGKSPTEILSMHFEPARRRYQREP